MKESAAVQPRGHGSLHVMPLLKGTAFFVVSGTFATLLDESFDKVLPQDMVLDNVVIAKGSKIVQVSFQGSSGPGSDCTGVPSRACFADWQASGFPDEGFIYAGRRFCSAGRTFGPSEWINPFQVRVYGLSGCLDKFAEYLRDFQDLQDKLHQLMGKKLVWHRALDQRCHVDIIIEEFRKWSSTARAPISVTAQTPWSWREFVDQALAVEHPFAKIACEPTVWRSAVLRARLGPEPSVAFSWNHSCAGRRVLVNSMPMNVDCTTRCTRT